MSDTIYFAVKATSIMHKADRTMQRKEGRKLTQAERRELKEQIDRKFNTNQKFRFLG